jgi:hypothetical protein
MGSDAANPLRSTVSPSCVDCDLAVLRWAAVLVLKGTPANKTFPYLVLKKREEPWRLRTPRQRTVNLGTNCPAVGLDDYIASAADTERKPCKASYDNRN